MQDRALVGRDHELRVLDQAIAAAVWGERAVLLITGEPGIGKTRLLEELVTRTLAASGVASWGRTWEVGQTPPFFPWMQALGTLGVPGDPAPLLDTLGHHEDRGARLERFSEIVRFLGRRAAHAPLTLLFDDVHASDLSSLELLDYALPLLAGKKVLFALAARDTDATRDVTQVLGRIQRAAYRLPLTRLDEAEVRTLVGDRADARRVYELSDGNPLFVQELMAAQRARGALGLPAVSSVRTLLRERVARLPGPTQRALSAAAVVGRDFRGRVITEMMGDHSLLAEGSATLLEPAIELGLVQVMMPASSGVFRFSHALVAEALANDLEGAARAELHASAARVLERSAPDDREAIAHHWLAAGEGAAREASSAAERAAESCMKKLAFEDAATFYERALACVREADGGRDRDDREKRARLLCARAKALQHATKHAIAAKLCDEAAAIVRDLPHTLSPEGAELFARIALVRGLEFRFGQTDPLLVAMLREALDRLGDRPLAVRAKLLARLAAAEQPSSDPLSTVALARDAIALARTLDARERLEVTYVATAALMDFVEPDVLEPILEDALGLARGVDRWISVHTRLRLCFTALARVDRAEFVARTQAFTAEADALGLARWQRHTPMLEAILAVLDGRFDDDVAAVARFEAASEELGDTGARFFTDAHRGVVAAIRTTPMDPGVRDRLGKYVPARAAIAAWLECQGGSVEATRSALDQLGGEFPRDPDIGAMVAEAIVFVRDAAFARVVYDLLLPRTGGIVVMANVGFAVMDLYDRLLLTLATTLERWSAVDEHATAALLVARKLGSPVWTARVQAAHADALERRGQGNDRARARELRAEARRTAERLGMTGLMDRCAAPDASPSPPALETIPVSVPPTRERGVSCTRQGSLWLVSGFGESVHVKDSRGMQMIARLVAEPSSPLHALDLAGASEAVDGGDAGEALDARARQAYRARLQELLADREEAERLGDAGRVERVNHEVDALSGELERAFGLGGRERRVGAASERARTNVQRRIAHAVSQIRAASPRLGEHLAASIRTGTYCLYEWSAGHS